MGIQPDILVLRTERHLDDALRMKVASFCNVDLECVVQSEDLPSIYDVPVNMQHQGLDAAILRKIGIPVGETPAMKGWHDFLEKQRNATREVHIGLVGKYDLQDAYKSIRESLNLAGIYNDVKAKLHFVNSEEITEGNVAEKLEGLAGIVICPGFGTRGIEGKIVAAEYTRSHDIPTFGICLGMQMMVIEFARNVLGYKDANSREMDERTPHNVIDIMEEQKSITQMGGTMRLGAYECRIVIALVRAGIFARQARRLAQRAVYAGLGDGVESQRAFADIEHTSVCRRGVLSELPRARAFLPRVEVVADVVPGKVHVVCA